MSENEASENYEKQLLERLNRLRIDEMFTDFAIFVGEEPIKAHKNVLAANSDYFKAMLTSESSEEIKNGRVTLEDIDPEIVKLIVNYWYTGKMEMTGENICSLLIVTSRFQANDILKICTKFAGTNLTAANCLSIALICERCNLVELFEAAFTCCLKKFEEIFQDTEILRIDEELLTKMISDDRLNVSDEIHVFVLIIRWIEFDRESRWSSLDKLMSQVRYTSIRPASLLEPSVTKIINNSAKYREQFERAKTILLLKDNPSLQRHHVGSFLSSPRESVLSAKRRLYVFGGYAQTAYVSMSEAYDPIANQWLELGDTPARIEQNHTAAISKNCVYAFSDEDKSRTFRYYDSDTNCWSHGAGFFDRTAIDGFIVALDGCIYSFGGGSHVGTASRYCFSDRAVEFCASMRVRRTKPGFVVHDHYIYVMGGLEPKSSCATRSVERYDTRRDKWEFVASMQHSRMSFSSCSYDGKIYIAGGSHGVQVMNQAEVYDPKLDTWTEIAPMNCSRIDFGLAELSGKIYAVGGLDGLLNPTNRVEAYNPDKNTWAEKREMRNKRRGHCVLVL